MLRFFFFFCLNVLAKIIFWNYYYFHCSCGRCAWSHQQPLSIFFIKTSLFFPLSELRSSKQFYYSNCITVVLKCFVFPQVLLPASSLLQINSVRDACCTFLMKQLHPTNCLGIRQFAGKYREIKTSVFKSKIKFQSC